MHVHPHQSSFEVKIDDKVLSHSQNISASVNKDIRIIFNREADIIYLSRIGSQEDVS